MRYNPDVPHRRSVQLKGYDYAKAGAYFVTICAWGKECVLGEVRGGTMHPSEAGQATERFWHSLTERFPLDAGEEPVEHASSLSPPTLGAVVRAFKSLSAIFVNRLLGRAQCPVWQRNYRAAGSTTRKTPRTLSRRRPFCDGTINVFQR